MARVMCCAAIAIAYSATTVLPAEVCADTNTHSARWNKFDEERMDKGTKTHIHIQARDCEAGSKMEMSEGWKIDVHKYRWKWTTCDRRREQPRYPWNVHRRIEYLVPGYACGVWYVG